MTSAKSERRFFLCTGERVLANELSKHPESHIIGELCYVVDEGEKVPALAVYEMSVSSNIIPSRDLRIRMHIIGDALGISCTSCRRKYKRWKISKAAERQLVQRYQRAILPRSLPS